MKVARNIRLIRKKWRFTQDDFGEFFEATRAMISSYESGVAEPRIPFLVKLYELSGIDITAICIDELTLEDIPEKPLDRPPARQKGQISTSSYFDDRLDKLEADIELIKRSLKQ